MSQGKVPFRSTGNNVVHKYTSDTDATVKKTQSYDDSIVHSKNASAFNVVAKGYAKGGYVDNVPAYLSEGEFVMSRQATNRLGASTLAAINEGTAPKQQHGESVVNADALTKVVDRLEKALDGKNLERATALFGQHVAKMEAALSKTTDKPTTTATGSSGQATPSLDFSAFGQYTTAFDSSVKNFGGSVTDFSSAIANFGKSVASLPSQITLSSSHDITVNVNGADAFNSIQSGLKEMVIATVGEEIDKFKSRLSSSGPGIA